MLNLYRYLGYEGYNIWVRSSLTFWFNKTCVNFISSSSSDSLQITNTDYINVV